MSDKTLQQRVEALEALFPVEPCIINSSRIGINADDDEETQLLECQLREDDDVQTIEEMHISGVQYNPPVESRAFFSWAWEELKMLIGINDRVPKEILNPGELLTYASSGGQIVCSVKYNDDGSIDITVPAGGNLIGNFNVTGDTNVDGDVIGDFQSTKISLLNHFHLGNLGVNTGPPVAGSGTPGPATPATTNANGDIIDGTPRNLSTHTHTQPNDSGGDTEGPTSTPV